MDNSWQSSYNELGALLKEHHEIEIRTNVVSIPGEVRPDFYRLFDNVRENFIKDRFPDAMEKAFKLRDNHEKVRTELVTAMGLREIEVRANLNEFLQNPMRHLTNLLFDPLFSVLKGESDLVNFEAIATQKIRSSLDSVLHQGYKSWLTLAVLKTLAPDKAYMVPLDNEIIDDCVCDAHTPGVGIEQPPDAISADRISFNSTPFCKFLAPSVIVHSQKLNLFASMVQEFRDVPVKARYPSEKLEWYELPELRAKLEDGYLWPDMAIYLSDQLNDLVLVSDTFKIARPDILIDILHPADWDSSSRTGQIIRRADTFQPKLASLVVFSGTPPASVQEIFKPVIETREQAKDTVGRLDTDAVIESRNKIQAIDVAYDTEKLESVVLALIHSLNKKVPSETNESQGMVDEEGIGNAKSGIA